MMGVEYRNLILFLHAQDDGRELGNCRVEVAVDGSRIRVSGLMRNTTGRAIRGVASLLYDWPRELYPAQPVEHPGQAEAGRQWRLAYCRRRGYDPADPHA